MARCDMACSRRCIVRVAPRLRRGEDWRVSVRVHIKKFEFMSLVFTIHIWGFECHISGSMI
jgi:hypothetical protein